MEEISSPKLHTAPLNPRLAWRMIEGGERVDVPSPPPTTHVNTTRDEHFLRGEPKDVLSL